MTVVRQTYIPKTIDKNKQSPSKGLLNETNLHLRIKVMPSAVDQRWINTFSVWQQYKAGMWKFHHTNSRTLQCNDLTTSQNKKKKRPNGLQAL